MDLGFYEAALSVLLFGEPVWVRATGMVLPSGVDGQGTMLLGYDGFEVACLHSKIAPGGVGSAITGGGGASCTSTTAACPTRVRLDLREGTGRDLTREQSEHHMRYEVEHFLGCVRAGTRRRRGRWRAPWPLRGSSTRHAPRWECASRATRDLPTIPTFPSSESSARELRWRSAEAHRPQQGRRCCCWRARPPGTARAA